MDSIIVTATVRSNELLNLNDVKAELRKRLEAAAQARKDAEAERQEAADLWDEAHDLLTSLGAADTESDATGRKVFLSLVSRMQQVFEKHRSAAFRECAEIARNIAAEWREDEEHVQKVCAEIAAAIEKAGGEK